jgi:hypothetical protein
VDKISFYSVEHWLILDPGIFDRLDARNKSGGVERSLEFNYLEYFETYVNNPLIKLTRQNTIWNFSSETDMNAVRLQHSE